ncbi:hypothetical protein [Janthinobacterium sp. PSPC3-1]|uniref:hypothetical protein n=1 Tax=Janthinobacterium sp. PSPC3-1 TaxID=2804653 RepID=UPI003CEA16E0
MDSDHVFSNVQWMNLQLLNLIHLNVKTNPVVAAYNFRLTTEQCARLSKMSSADIQALADNMSGESLFLPRSDFLQLLDAPACLSSILSVVRPPTPSNLSQNKFATM